MTKVNYLVRLCLLVFCLSYQIHASCHVSNCDDSEFIKLGKQYSAVGCFSSDSDGGIFGSGTLVELGIPDLEGSVVITCAHLFFDPVTHKLKNHAQNNITFVVGSEAPRKGTFHVHPSYGGTYETSYDIGIFVLAEPIKSIKPVLADLESTLESLLSKQFVSSGFGVTGHVLGKYSIFDLERRASYAHALPYHNPLTDVTFPQKLEQFGQWTERTVICPKGSVLSLCPYVSSSCVDENNTLETCNKPAGTPGGADSGGGCFSQQGKLVGVISNDCSHIIDRADKVQEKELCVDSTYISKYGEAYKGLLDNQNKLYENIKNSFQDKPKELDDFLKRCPTPMQMPKIISSEETNTYAKPHYSKELFDTTAPNRLSLSVSHEITLLAFHKEWILKTLGIRQLGETLQ